MKLDVKIAEHGDELAACMALRWAVFVEEQNVTEDEENDGEDTQCTHVLATLNGIPVGTARFQHIETYVKIQRVCVPKEQRGHGIGAEVINFIIDQVSNNGPSESIRLGAQTHALDFYRKLGFVEFGSEYLDAGIVHVDMELSLG